METVSAKHIKTGEDEDDADDGSEEPSDEDEAPALVNISVKNHPQSISCWLTDRGSWPFSQPIHREPPRTFNARSKIPSTFLSIIFVTNHIYVTAAM